jgi:hypothetical protein
MKKLIYISIVTLFVINLVSCGDANAEHNGEYVEPPDNYAGRITLTNNPDERYGWDDAIENVMCFYK